MRIMRTIKTIYFSIRLKLSGIFDSRLYKTNNPDIGRFPPLLHWGLFGRYEEGRSTNLSPLFKWIRSRFLQGRISVRDARKIRRHVKRRTMSCDIANQYDLNFHDFLFMQHVHNDLYDKAKAVLQHCSNEIYLEGAFYFASKRMQYDFLYPTLTKFNEYEVTNTRYNRMLADIRQTLGEPNTAQIMRMIDTIPKDTSRLMTQIFSARLPIVKCQNASLGFFKQQASGFGLSTVARNDLGQAGEFARNVEGYESLINCATYNSLNPENLYCVTSQPSFKLHAQSLEVWNGRTVKIRLLMPQYWVDPHCSHGVTKNVLTIHKNLINHLLKQNIAVVPLFSTPLYDITHESNFGIPTISYHTISKNNTATYLHYKEAYLPGYFCGDQTGYSGWSSLANGLSAFDKAEADAKVFHEELIEYYVKNNISKYLQTHKICETLPPDFIFVALQISEDTVSYWAYLDRAKWVEYVCLYGQRHNIPVVIKVHPKDNSIQTEALVDSMRGYEQVYVSMASVHELIARSTAVVTCNSGVGFEALVQHKPVITCGLSDYQSITYLVKTETELEAALNKSLSGQPPASHHDINHFLYHYCHTYCMRTDLSEKKPLTNFIQQLSSD